MKAYMLITGSGPIVILTSHDSVVDAALIKKLAGKGIEKFIAYEIPIGLAQERYGAHFALVQGDVREADDFRSCAAAKATRSPRRQWQAMLSGR